MIIGITLSTITHRLNLITDMIDLVSEFLDALWVLCFDFRLSPSNTLAIGIFVHIKLQRMTMNTGMIVAIK